MRYIICEDSAASVKIQQGFYFNSRTVVQLGRDFRYISEQTFHLEVLFRLYS